MKAKDKIIFALDVPTLKEALQLVENLYQYVGIFKVGLELLHSEGTPRVIRAIHEKGGRVLVDAKLHDIPNTVAGASRAIAKLGAEMFNVHASGGEKMIKSAIENKGNSKVLGVTVLTSIDEDECISIFGDTPGTKVLQFAQILSEYKADGIICSPQELKLLSKQHEFSNLLKVNPGVRPLWAAKGDQSRVTTPTDAIKNGADYLVIGRPIREPPPEIGSPIEAAKMIAEEIAGAIGE